MNYGRSVQIAALLLLGTMTLSHAASGDLIADNVLGQLNLTSGTLGSTATTLNNPNNAAVDPITGRIYVCDTLNNRVLGWPSASGFQNADPADLVIGQTNFTNNLANQGGTAAATTLSAPNAVVVDSQGNLYVSDGGNNRVLVYTNPSLFGTGADIVIGQANFTASAAAVTAGGLNFPFGVHLDERGNLFVADSSNHRVLEYDSPYTSGENAVRVWGQPNFTSAVINNGGIGAGTLNTPTGMDFDDSGNMYICDFGNNRVLEYNRNSSGFPNLSSDRVFGQPNFVTAVSGTSATQLSLPEGVLSDINGALYVADRANNRVVIFDSPLTSATATRVIGQTSLTTGTAGTSATALSTPKGVTSDAFGNIFITDTANSRLLRYNVVFSDTAPVTQYTSSDTVSIPASTTFGEANPFPSVIHVSNLAGTVTKVTVTLKHLSHTWPDDIDMYLVGPGGQGVILMSDCGGGNRLDNVSLIFDDNAANNLPDSTVISSGSYKPTNYALDGPTIDALGTTLGIFNGVNPNGDWRLFAVDDTATDVGEVFGWGLNIFTAPTLDSGPTSTPSTASVGQTVSFSASVSATPGVMVGVTWDFGDATSGGGLTPTHAYTTAGIFTVVVTVNDGIAAPVTGTTSVTIVAPLVGTGVDTDGDGFSDAFEIAAGTNPTSAMSTPTGGTFANVGKLDLPDVKLSIALNFAKANSDSITLTGTLLVPDGYSPTGKTAIVDVGGVTKVFTLTSSGSALSAANSLKISVKGSASTAKFSAKFGKESFAAELLDEGLVNATVGTTVHVKATIIFGNQVFIKNQTLTYKAIANKSGKSK